MLSIILPTFNEAESIKKTINSILKTIEPLNIKYEIIVSDDNSPDKTWQIVEQISKNNKNIKILRRFENKGLSNAVIEALQMAKGERFLLMDADGQHDEKIIPQMLSESKNNDIVVGSRYTQGASLGEFSFLRALISKSASLLSYPFLRKKNISDPMSGFFMIKKSHYKSVLPYLQISGYKILLDILFASKNSIKIKEIPYTFKNRKYGKSKLGFGVMFNYIEMLIIHFLKQNKTIIKFLIVGATGIIINLGSLYLLVEQFKFTYILASALATELSIISNFFFNNHWTFHNRKTKATIFEKFLKFNLVSITSLIINVTTMIILVNLGFWYIFAQFIGILNAFIINYTINNNWVFRENNN